MSLREFAVRHTCELATSTALLARIVLREIAHMELTVA